MSSPVTAAFYFDLGSPEAYLAAERILHVLPAPAEWRPVLARELPGVEAGEERSDEERAGEERSAFELRAHQAGLQPLRWPSPFPFDSSLAMRVASYARSIGRTVPFAQAAFRQAFAGGHSLENPDFVLIAAAACEMHPAAVLRGAEMRSVREQLAASTAEAAELGVTDIPAVVVNKYVFQGPDAPERAAEHITADMAAHAR